MVNFLSMFCPELQKLLKPIYDLTRRGTSFICREEQQVRLVHVPVLHMPNRQGFIYIPILVSLQQVAHYIKFRMVSQN